MSLTELPKLSTLPDIDVTARGDGSMIIWDNSTSTFKVKGQIENLNLSIIGGSF
jgi:hypothetical protein